MTLTTKSAIWTIYNRSTLIAPVARHIAKDVAVTKYISKTVTERKAARLVIPRNWTHLAHRVVINFPYRLKEDEFQFLYTTLQQSKLTTEQEERRQRIVCRVLEIEP